MGISNPFARKDLLDFFHTAGESSLGQDRPVMAFHALMAGDEILATSVGSFCGPHFSQYINSTADGEAARYSLMGILMLELLQELWDSGVRTIDLGLGDFDYKLDWAEKEEVYDSFIPLSWPARLLVPTLATIREGKRRIKQDEKLWATARRIRAIAHRTASVGTSIPVSRVLREKA
jgi:CelD/BcsL family acetyltransferase involved in cellulose biosynthesis